MTSTLATLFSDEALGDEEKLSYGRGLARNIWVWFTHELLILVPRAVPGLKTFGVTENGFLLWDPACVQLWTTKEIAAVLLHECCHRLQRHIERVREGHIDPSIGNQAGDLTINTLLRDAGLTLPTRFPDDDPSDPNNGPLFPEKFGFPPGLIMEEYVELLLKKREKDSQKKPGQGQPGNSNEGSDGDQAKPRVGQGWCGSCAGKPLPNEPAANDPEARSQADIERAHRATAEAMVDAEAKRAGSVPADFLRWANTILKPPKIDWHKQLARYIRSAIGYRAGAVDFTWRRLSRRQAGIGFGPGKPVLPGMFAPQPRAAIVFDTSGSMCGPELEAGASESLGVLRMTGAAVDLIVFDVEVHACRKVKDVTQLVASLKGGGGTSFVQAFEALEKLNPKPEVAICITDGYDDGRLKGPPAGISIIWLLVGHQVRTPYPWGRAVRVELDADAESGW